jgi:hypothetical protein
MLWSLLEEGWPMPTKSRREDIFIKLFVSAYEDNAWAGADLCWLDQILDGAVDLLATRKDGRTLAIEHTLLEPFVGDRRDFEQFARVFPSISDDQSLALPERWTRVFVPVGILDGQKEAAREALAAAVKEWLRANRLSLPDGESEHRCPVPRMPGDPTREITLTVIVNRLGEGATGTLQIGRQQMKDDFREVMEKALSRKVPKLVATPADKRVLILERAHFNFFQEQILDEIEKQRPAVPDLAKIDEIWILETVFYQPGGNFQFDLYTNNHVRDSLRFDGETLTGRARDGMAVPT